MFWPLPRPKDINKMSDLFKVTFLHIIKTKCPVLFHMLKYIPGFQELYDKVVTCNPWQLRFILAHFKTQKICIKAVKEEPWLLGFIPAHVKTQEMCDDAVEKNSWGLDDTPDCL